ncbi:MAG: hypothetical protein LBU11_04990 [Zoogloeaceae bacterium]|jgi:hypothetical protein|nr:hypothetical protein [Zoogloeaceae bacterium]
MNTKDLFDYAELAEASYVRFDLLKKDFSDESVKTALTTKEADGKEYKGEFSATQADDFVAKWQVVSHIPDTDSGFSATLFREKETGKYVYALRGTAGKQDLSTDFGDLVIDGLAFFQIVDMYNDWKRLITPDGQSYEAARLSLQTAETAALAAEYAVSPIAGYAYAEYLLTDGSLIIDRPSGKVYRIELGDSRDFFDTQDPLATGIGAITQQNFELDVSGHSLGGHLAAAFTRLFPDTGAEAFSLNGAGYPTENLPGLSGNAQENIAHVFATLKGASGFDAGRIHNLHGSAAPEFITMDSCNGLKQQGSHDEIFTESWDVSNTLGHGVNQMVNALAIMNLFIRLDENLGKGTPALVSATSIRSHGIRFASTANGRMPKINHLLKTGTEKIIGTHHFFHYFSQISEGISVIPR